MTPRERLLATLRGQKADRVPLVMEGFHHASPGDVTDLGKRDIVERVPDQLHFFVTCLSYVNRYFVSPPQRMKEVSREVRDGEMTATTQIDTPKGNLSAVTGRNKISDTIWTLKYPVESLEDIEKIRAIPWELPHNLMPPDLSSLPSSFETRGIVHTAISSPFVCVAGMMPYDYFLELCARELNLLKELTAECQKRIMDILDVVLSDATVEYVWMGGCEWVTPPMASARAYEELVQAFEKPVIERIHKGNALCHIHCHGNVRSTIERVIQRGADFFEPVEPPPDGDISFAEAKSLVDGRMTLGGNVEFRVLQNDSPEAVEETTRWAFDGDKRRMVLQPTAGPIGLMDSILVRNYHKMIDVWEELSPIE